LIRRFRVCLSGTIELSACGWWHSKKVLLNGHSVAKTRLMNVDR